MRLRGRDDPVLHLHRFDDHERRAGLDGLTVLREDLDDRPRHRGEELGGAAARRERGAAGAPPVVERPDEALVVHERRSPPLLHRAPDDPVADRAG